jgi:hypothetical protein
MSKILLNILNVQYKNNNGIMKKNGFIDTSSLLIKSGGYLVPSLFSNNNSTKNKSGNGQFRL